ncbi:MAG: signal recognition particle [Candidatus Thermoplasmatota archaeon]|jgi:signal recognition particle subunit SRP19|nr:signal recognition particle [Candidatus Thermoplasmatota archaeon]MCL5794166.1 signal recognition particle [Candidatus Thermoplasmatota archaeon]
MKITLYSDYFNPRITRRLGRRIPRATALKFSEERLTEILKSMNIKYERREGAYPRLPWSRGFIYDLESEVRKSTVLKMIERRLEKY